MGNAPGMDNRRLMRGLVAGAVLALLAVGLFMLLWVGLDSTGLEQFPRLILSLCVPPAVVVVLVGGYALITHGRKQ